MKIEELRIGNLVTDEFYDSFKSIIVIDSIDKNGINLEIQDDGRYAEIAERWIEPNYEIGKLKPIPLTEEWLIKFGFETKHSLTDVHYCKFLQDEYDFTFCLSIKNGYNVFYINYKNDYDESCFVLQVKYVHQLQNLYFALTGSELQYVH